MPATSGKIFRPDNAALPPNWKHLPIGYHGRSGTVIVSGTDVVRPSGQRKAPSDLTPVFGPSIRLDIEAELGYVVGGATEVGTRVSVDEAADHLFGVVLLNDWSARDIQAWEYVPLGPFLGKSFATSISAWVTPLDALAQARLALPGQEEPAVLPYLEGPPAFGLDIHLEVALNGTVVSRPEHAGMYWSPVQMLAHLTVNGASLRDGDLFGSGTVSGPEKGTRGSLLELTWNGTEPAHPRGRLDPRLPRGRRHRDDDRLGARTGRQADRPRRGLGDDPPQPLTATPGRLCTSRSPNVFTRSGWRRPSCPDRVNNFRGMPAFRHTPCECQWAMTGATVWSGLSLSTSSSRCDSSRLRGRNSAGMRVRLTRIAATRKVCPKASAACCEPLRHAGRSADLPGDGRVAPRGDGRSGEWLGGE